MSQRTVAGLVAAPVVLVLLVVAWLVPLPYVVYSPGLTLNVLAGGGGKAMVDVSGHRTYPTSGQLRMVTVSVTRPDAHLGLPELLQAWFSRDDAVYPWDAVYTKGTSNQQSDTEGAVQMVTSQDVAAAVALRELGYEMAQVPEIVNVGKGEPADGRLKAHDLILAIDGKKPASVEDVIDHVKRSGRPLDVLVKRNGKERHVTVTPTDHDGTPKIGATIGMGYDFPFPVSVDVDPDIGGPSAGLMFSLSIYDTLTPGSLTGGASVAGTGEIETDGSVGPIGGIQQKIAGAKRDGAKLFLVPKDNCADAAGANHGDMRLISVDTMHDAVTEIEAWAKDHDANLPACS